MTKYFEIFVEFLINLFTKNMLQVYCRIFFHVWSEQVQILFIFYFYSKIAARSQISKRFSVICFCVKISDNFEIKTKNPFNLGEFDDGLDEELMGDDEDRRKLEMMNEKEREEEIFKRAEKRELLKKRYEIEKKLKMQKRTTKEEEKSLSKALDTKERSRARKEAVENKKDKKTLALDVLKAKRKEKQEQQQKIVSKYFCLWIRVLIVAKTNRFTILKTLRRSIFTFIYDWLLLSLNTRLS